MTVGSEPNDLLKCSVNSISYNFVTRVGHLYMADDNCCDMAGCIKLFTSIDRHCRRIDTFAGVVPDVVYMCPLGSWGAYVYNGPRLVRE